MAGVLISGSSTVNALGAITINREVAVEVTKEVTKDMVLGGLSDQAVSSGVEFAQKKFGFNNTTALLFEIGAGLATDKVINGPISKTIAVESGKLKGVDIDQRVPEILGGESGTDVKIYPARLADKALDDDFLKNANAMKDKLPTWAKNKGNFGYGEVAIEGLDDTQFFAHSSIQAEIPSVKDSGISIKPEFSSFKTVEVNGSNVVNGEDAWSRDVDIEYKILSDIQSKLGNNFSTSGKIKLYTELEPCPSCRSVIEQFKEMYSNIDIEVIYSIEK